LSEQRFSLDSSDRIPKLLQKRTALPGLPPIRDQIVESLDARLFLQAELLTFLPPTFSFFPS